MKDVQKYLANTTNIYILLGLALLFRLVLIPHPGFEADITFWKSWGLAVRDFGIVKGLPVTNFNYPTPFAYLLGVMATVYSLFADPHNFNEFWTNTNALFLAIAKAPSIVADFGIFAVIVWIGKSARRRSIPFPQLPLTFYLFLAFLYLLNPLAFFDGALWGQVDSLGVVLFLIANCFIWKKMPVVGGIIYMVSMMTKLQNMIYGPVFFLFTWQYLGFHGFLKAAAASFATFLGLNIEFILARDMGRVAGDLTGNYDYFPWLSLNAYNVWWIAAGARGMDISDKILTIGIANAKTVGLYLFSSTYLLATLFMAVTSLKKMWQPKNPGPTDQTLMFRYITALIIVCAGFFLFQTQSHDRYAFPIAVFALLWAPFFFAVTDPKSLERVFTSRLLTWFLLGYAFFTVIFFYNIHNAMIANYPNNGIPFLSIFNIPSLTIFASFIQIGLFLFFLWIIRRHIGIPLFAVSIGAFVILVTAANIPYIMKKPIPISKLSPAIQTTGYGRRQTNMPVNAYFGFSKWGFLSVQYAFYRTGLGTHAPSREVFDINRRFTTLTTDYGVDTNGGPQGSVQFLVYGDGRLLFSSETITRYEFPRHTEVDVRGVKTLELIVSDAGNGNFDDHADWLNTYLIPR